MLDPKPYWYSGNEKADMAEKTGLGNTITSIKISSIRSLRKHKPELLDM